MSPPQLQPLDTDRDSAPNARRRLATGIGAVLVLATGWAVVHGTGQAPAPARTTSTAPAPASATPGVDAVTYQDVAGMRLPVSSVDGPHDVRGGRATGFAHTDRGAALAAVHLLVRTFPFVGSAVFAPTIAEQVVGTDAAALARVTAEAYELAARAAKVGNGAPLTTSNDGWVAGYRLDQPGTVAVLLRQSDGEGGDGFVEYRVQLLWQDGDWRLVAPAWGDWRTAATATTAADRSHYFSYDDAAPATRAGATP